MRYTTYQIDPKHDTKLRYPNFFNQFHSKVPMLPPTFANGCIGLNGPVTKQSPKLSSDEKRQCLDG